jgi:serine phosphatase RsbU (regulator of sigma subunit)
MRQTNDLLSERVPLIAALPSAERALLWEAASVVTLPAGVLLFHEGERGDRLSIVVEGEVEIVKAAGTRDERLLAVRGAGEFLGEMSLLFPERRRTASGRAGTDVTLIEVGQNYFTELLHRQPSIAVGILRSVVTRLRDSDDAMIRDLRDRNDQLARAYEDLRHAQAELVAQAELDQELLTARRIQQSLLPETLPAIPGWTLAAHWEPARAVGGDFYDVMPLPDGRWGITIGDVTGKGIPAALLMAMTRTNVRAAASDESSPAAILARANELVLPDMPPRTFVTCQFLALDSDSGQITLANAGHPLPLHRASDSITEVRATGMPLGLMPGMAYDECATTIGAGEQLLLVSDGIIEAHAPDGEMFGIDRLLGLLASLPSDAPLEAYCAAKTTFCGPEGEQEDDVTLVRMSRGQRR